MFLYLNNLLKNKYTYKNSVKTVIIIISIVTIIQELILFGFLSTFPSEGFEL